MGGKRNRCILAVIILWFDILQGFSLNPWVIEKKYIFNPVVSGNNRSQSIITCILQDRYGFIWFGTQDGLNRFDGYNYTIYKNDPDDSNSLLNNYITCLAALDNGEMLIGTSGGLCSYFPENKTWKHIGNQSPVEKEHITALTCDLNGNIWIGTYHNGVYIFQTQTGTIEPAFFQNNNIIDPEITAFYHHNTDTIWIGTRKGLYRATVSNRQAEKIPVPFEPAITFEMVMALTGDGKNKLWVLIFEKYMLGYTISDGKWEKIEVPLSVEQGKLNYGNCIIYDKKGLLYAGMSRGLLIYDLTEKKWFEPEDFTCKKILAEKNVIFLLKDHRGSVWISHWGEICRMDEPLKKFLTPAWYLGNNDLTHGKILTSVVEDSMKNLWIGTDNDGLIYWDRIKNTMKLYNSRHNSNGLLSDNVMCLLYDSEKTLWIGTWSGLNYIPFGETRCKSVANSISDNNMLPDNIVRYLFEDSKHRLWIGTEEGLAVFDKNRKKASAIYLYNAGNINSLTNNKINHINEDHSGKIWISTEDGLNGFEPENNKWTRFFHSGGNTRMSSHCIYQVHFLNDTALLITTRGAGIILFNPVTGNFKMLAEKQGLANQNVYAALIDKNGKAWLTSNRGISVFDLNTHLFTNYCSSDGLINEEFNNNSSFRSKEGILYFGSINGLIFCNPEDIKADTAMFPVVLTQCRKLNRPGSISCEPYTLKNLAIKYTDKNLYFEWAGLNFIQTGRNQYFIQLENFDKEWISNNTSRNVTYTNLPPGNYTLKIKAINADGYETDAAIALPVSVSAPFWMKTWFHLLVILILFLAALWVQYLRVKIIRKRNIFLEKKVAEQTESLRTANQQLTDEVKLKNKFFYIIAHDLKSPMNAIVELSRQVKDKIHEIPRPETEMLYQAANSVNKLIDSLLQWSATMTGKIKYQPEPVFINILIDRMAEELRPAAQKKQIDLMIKTEEDLIAWADENMILTVLRNLVSNAVKFSYPSNNIRISALHDKKNITVSIHNNGPLLSHEDIKRLQETNDITPQTGTANEKGTGLGLQVCKEFLAHHKSTLTIASDALEGNVFGFSLPKAGI